MTGIVYTYYIKYIHHIQYTVSTSMHPNYVIYMSHDGHTDINRHKGLSVAQDRFTTTWMRDMQVVSHGVTAGPWLQPRAGFPATLEIRENIENESPIFQSGKTQGIWGKHPKSGENRGIWQWPRKERFSPVLCHVSKLCPLSDWLWWLVSVNITHLFRQ